MDWGFKISSFFISGPLFQEAMVPVIIPASIDPIAGVADEVLNRIPHVEGIGGTMRALQRHIVQVPRQARAKLIDARSAAPIAPDKYAEQFVRLTNRDLYSADVGLNWNDPTYRDSVIRDRFNQARRQLDDARRELADARDTLNKYVEPTP